MSYNKRSQVFLAWMVCHLYEASVKPEQCGSYSMFSVTCCWCWHGYKTWNIPLLSHSRICMELLGIVSDSSSLKPVLILLFPLLPRSADHLGLGEDQPPLRACSMQPFLLFCAAWQEQFEPQILRTQGILESLGLKMTFPITESNYEHSNSQPATKPCPQGPHPSVF